jgi:hypothetical protein
MVANGVTMFVGPPTVVTALAFFYGWTLTNARSSYFGLDPSTLGFSTSDYLLRSTDALFVPVGAVLLVVLAALAAHAAVSRAGQITPIRHWLRGGAVGVAVLGAVVATAGVWAVFDALPVRVYYLLPPLLLAGGVTLTHYGLWVWATLAPGPPEAAGRAVRGPLGWARPIVVMIVLLGGFWTMSLYAGALGRGRAEELGADVRSLPVVTIYSRQSLAIEVPGVRALRISEPDSRYRYRYSGLRLLIRSGAKYFLLPQSWTPRSGVTVVLPDTDDLRVEFAPGW